MGAAYFRQQRKSFTHGVFLQVLERNPAYYLPEPAAADLKGEVAGGDGASPGTATAS